MTRGIEESSDGPLAVAADGFVSLAGLNGARLVRAEGDACREADYVVVYVFDRQLGRPAARTYAAAEPELTAWVNGLPYAWVYRGGWPCAAPDD